MNTIYAEALVEVNEILKFTDPNITKKIPISFKNFIVDNMSKTYSFDASNPALSLKSETESILALIYRNYICSPEQKEILLQKEFKNIQETQVSTENASTIKFKDLDEIFSKKSEPEKVSTTTTTSSSSTALVEYKEKWYIVLLEKLLNKLKSL